MTAKEAIMLLDEEPVEVSSAPFSRDRYKTPAEFARMTGLGYKYVLKLVKTNGFPAFRPFDSSNRFYIDTVAVGEWMRKQSKKPKKSLGY